jgi:hypothetical protein
MPTLTSCIKGHASKAVGAALFAALLCAQPPIPTTRTEDEPKRMPDGRLLSEMVRKQDFKDNLEDIEQMKRLLDTVKDELEKSEGHILSIRSLKNLEEIEKLTRRVRGRMKKN